MFKFQKLFRILCKILKKKFILAINILTGVMIYRINHIKASSWNFVNKRMKYLNVLFSFAGLFDWGKDTFYLCEKKIPNKKKCKKRIYLVM